MRNGLLILAVVVTALGAVSACPPALREQVAEQTRIPDSVRLETGRQIDLVVSWARGDQTRPTQDFIASENGTRDLD